MNRFFHIATNLVSALGLILGVALFSSTEAREFVLQHGSVLVVMVLPLTILIMLLQVLLEVGGESHAGDTPALKWGYEIANEATHDQAQADNKKRLPLRWG